MREIGANEEKRERERAKFAEMRSGVSCLSITELQLKDLLERERERGRREKSSEEAERRRSEPELEQE